MDITLKEIEPCKLSVSYTANAEEILSKRGEVLKAFKKAPVPGCRPGKASLSAIKIHYRSQIEDSLKRALAEDAYHNTIFEKKLRPHGSPQFNSLLMDGGKFTCEFDLHVKPEFELNNYRDFSVPLPHKSINAQDMCEKSLQDLRVRFGTATPYQPNDFVQMGDNLIIDYEASMDGTKIDALCSQGEMLTVGNSQLPNFDDSLLGLKMCESKEFDIVIPENGLPSFAGKTVHFSVTLGMGSKNIPCPLDDELATKTGKKTYAELKEFVMKSAMARVQELERASMMESIASYLLESTKFDVPNWLAVSEAKYLVHNSKLEWDKLADVDREKYIEMASKNVRLSLILDRIRDVEPEAQLSDQEVFDMIKKNISQTKVDASIDDIIKEMNRTGYLQILFSRIRDEHTLDFIVKTVKFVG